MAVSGTWEADAEGKCGSAQARYQKGIATRSRREARCLSPTYFLKWVELAILRDILITVFNPKESIVTTSTHSARTVAGAAHDRIDVLLMGRGKAARHRVTRLLNPTAAREFRRDALGIAQDAPEAPNARSGKVATIPARLDALFGLNGDDAA